MTIGNLSVKQSEIGDLESIVGYFLNADKDFLTSMGVDAAKLPPKEDWLNILRTNFYLPPDKKQFYYVIWLIDGHPVGHSNINKIVFGKEAFMHLHLWQGSLRRKGIGTSFLKMTLPFYFDTFKLKTLYCEPSATNQAPNKTLENLGFEFVKSYETAPGWINNYQLVNRWCLTSEKFDALD